MTLFMWFYVGLDRCQYQFTFKIRIQRQVTNSYIFRKTVNNQLTKYVMRRNEKEGREGLGHLNNKDFFLSQR